MHHVAPMLGLIYQLRHSPLKSRVWLIWKRHTLPFYRAVILRPNFPYIFTHKGKENDCQITLISSVWSSNERLSVYVIELFSSLFAAGLSDTLKKIACAKGLKKVYVWNSLDNLSQSNKGLIIRETFLQKMVSRGRHIIYTCIKDITDVSCSGHFHTLYLLMSLGNS